MENNVPGRDSISGYVKKGSTFNSCKGKLYHLGTQRVMVIKKQHHRTPSVTTTRFAGITSLNMLIY